jgi:opacity protein-like surface antigen
MRLSTPRRAGPERALRASRRAILACVLLLAAPATARADFFVVPFLGMKFGGSTSIVDLELAAGKKKLVLGAAAMQVDEGIIGYEVSFANVSGYFSNEDFALENPIMKAGSYVSDLTAAVLLSAPPGMTGGGLRPYGVIGGGLIHAEAEDFLEIFQVRRTVPALTFGGGASGLITNNVGVRFDVRYVRSLSRDDPSIGDVGRRINYWRFTVGLLLRP